MLGLENTKLNRMFVDHLIAPVLEPFLNDILPKIPSVGDHNDEKVDSLRELWDFIYGFKDGIVGVTGGESKAYLCNGNLSIANSIWYWNYVNMFDGNHFTEDNDVYQASMIDLMFFVQESLQWPYFVLYNCYWAGYELYTP